MVILKFEEQPTMVMQVDKQPTVIGLVKKQPLVATVDIDQRVANGDAD